MRALALALCAAACAAPPFNPSPRAVRGACSPGMFWIPTGTFVMGRPDRRASNVERPLHPVTLTHPFCIDRTEVTVAAYALCVDAGACAAPARGDARCNDRDRLDHPVNCIGWVDAERFCRFAGKRLPTEAEWEWAARGPDGRAYPWGDERPDRGRACYLTGGTDLVGSYPAGASPYGLLDMAGNVAEWVADWLAPYAAPAVVDPRGSTGAPSSSPGRVVRGGSFADDEDGIAATHRATFGDDRPATAGVRCAAEPL